MTEARPTPTTTNACIPVESDEHSLTIGPDGPILLHLHGLGEHTPPTVPAHLEPWPGAVWGLDLSGHGQSSVAPGAGYFCEGLMGDADIALAHLGRVTIYGRGLGAYIGLLVAGARAELVGGTILTDGPGLAGGGPWPSAPSIACVPVPLPVTISGFSPASVSATTRPRRRSACTATRSARSVNGITCCRLPQ